MRSPNVCFQGQCGIDLQALNMIRMPWLPFVPLLAQHTLFLTHMHTHTHTPIYAGYRAGSTPTT